MITSSEMRRCFGKYTPNAPESRQREPRAPAGQSERNPKYEDTPCWMAFCHIVPQSGGLHPLVASSRITPRFSKIRPKADNSGVGGYCSLLLKIVVLQLWPQSQGAIARSIPGNDKRFGISIPKGGGQAHVVASPEEMVTAPGANPKTKSTFCWGTTH